MPKIKMFTTHTCPYCFMLKDYLTKHNVSFEEVYIDSDAEGAVQAVDACGSMATPCTHITLESGEEVNILGFHKPKFDDVLGLA